MGIILRIMGCFLSTAQSIIGKKLSIIGWGLYIVVVDKVSKAMGVALCNSAKIGHMQKVSYSVSIV